MFHSALSLSGRNLVAVLVGLLWFGAAACLPAVAQQDGAHAEAGKEAHPVAEKAIGDAAPAHGDAEHAGHGDSAHGDSHSTASPSPMAWKTDLALWSLIVFIFFVVILKVFAWKPLAGALSNREAKIKGDLAQAEEARIKAEKMLADYKAQLATAQDEVLKTLAEARRDAEHTRQEILAQTEKEVAASKQRAILEIQRTKDAALEELFGHIAGTVANATERVLGRALTDADQERLIGDALAEFSRNQAS